MDKKQEFLKLIAANGIKNNDFVEWSRKIESSSEEMMDALLDFFSRFPDKIEWFNEIYKKKKAAFSQMQTDREKGEAMFSEIFQEEKEKLDAFAQ